MFSTINTPISHIVRVFSYSSAGEKIPINIPAKFELYERNIRHVASESNINRLKNAMQKERWVLKNKAIVNAETLQNDTADTSYYRAIALNKIIVEL
jgi:hypothetical protein